MAHHRHSLRGCEMDKTSANNNKYSDFSLLSSTSKPQSHHDIQQSVCRTQGHRKRPLLPLLSGSPYTTLKM